MEIHNFQKHTEVRWLSLGPSVQRILEQWDCICSFMKDLGKDPKTAPKSVAYKRVSAMLTDKEGRKTKAQLEFMGNVSPVFEDFLTIFQNSCPEVHLLYDKMSEFLRKLMGRFLRSVKDAVKFYDSENLRPEKIALTNALLTAVRSAHTHHRQRLDEEEAEKGWMRN